MPSRDADSISEEARPLRGEARAAFLETACMGDAALRAEVEALLEADAESDLETAEADPHATIAADAADSAPVFERRGEMIGRYKLLEQIGEGGFGTVWAAEQREPVRRRVALKIIKLGMDTKQVIARFEAERQALAMMDHPNIAKVLDAGSTETGRPFFAMELVKGVPILEYCDTEKLDTRARLDLFMKVCHAIQHAHQKGIIHRDIKPSNVLVTLHDGVPVPKVIDFGIAKATNQELTDKTLYTQHRQMIGTPAYMSPEQAEMSGLDIDTRSDIYALGVLLYELLTGTTPFDSKSLLEAGFAEMMRIIREDTPHKPSTRLSSLGKTATRTAQLRHAEDPNKLGLILRGDLDWIVMRCLEKDRTRRYDTANGLAADIQRHLHDQPVSAGPPGTGYRLRKFMKRNRAGVAASVVIALAGTIGLAGLGFGLWRTAASNRSLLVVNNKLTESNRQLDESLTEIRAQRDRAANAERRTEAINEYLVQGILAAAKPDELGHDARVVDVLDRARRSIPERLKDDADLRAALYKALAWTYDSIGLFQQAAEAAKDARSSLLEAYDGSIPLNDERLSVEESVALTQYHLGELDRAEEELTKTIAWTQDPSLDLDRANVISLSVALAQIREAQRRPEEAVELLEPLIEELRTLDPIDRKLTLTALGALVTSLTSINELDRALASARELRTLALEWDGASSESGMFALGKLAVVHRMRGDLNTAAEILVELAEAGEHYFGPTHPARYSIPANAGMVLKNLGRFDQAEPYLLRAYDAVVRIHGDTQYEAERLSTFLSDFYRQAGRPADALPWLERRYLLRLKIAGPGEEPSLRSAWPESHEQLAAVHELLGTKNPPTFRDLAIDAAISTPEEDANRARFLGNTARSLISVEDYAEAERLLLLAVPALEFAGRPEETRQIVYDSLAAVCRATGRPDEAEGWESEARELPSPN